jgi:L-2-hydroxyglutarate oxidase LhgO
MDEVDVVVAGAGVVGLAVAREFAQSGRSVLVLEKEATFGSGTSSRNSEVIHAGIYYPEGSLKAELCVKGRELLYPYLIDRAIPHRPCGKFIVATQTEQISSLEQIKQRAEIAGVHNLQWKSPEEVRSEEPMVECVRALFSPSTGIVDSHSYMQSLLADLQNRDGMLVTRTEVDSVRRLTEDRFIVSTTSDGGYDISTKIFINSAGLGAQRLASRIDELDRRFIPPLFYSRGAYFVLSRSNVFSHLIYPVPEPGGLGVHVTMDLGGQIRFGPDVEWIQEECYDLDPRRAVAFYDAIRRYFPDLQDGELSPGYTGIRPKLVPRGVPDADFMISGPQDHGLAGLVNLFGIESPGLTASLAIAKKVKSILI